MLYDQLPFGRRIELDQLSNDWTVYVHLYKGGKLNVQHFIV